MDHCREMTERPWGLGSKTREGVGKVNEMTALRFQTGERKADIPGLPSGLHTQSCSNRQGNCVHSLFLGWWCKRHLAPSDQRGDEPPCPHAALPSDGKPTVPSSEPAPDCPTGGTYKHTIHLNISRTKNEDNGFSLNLTLGRGSWSHPRKR